MFVHFVWFGPRALGYAELLAVRTAEQVYGIKPTLWVDDTVPENEWLEQIRQHVKCEQIPAEWLEIASVANFYVHKTDYLRCRLLHDFGGLYLDIDTLCIKSILDLDLHGVVVGYEPAANPSKPPVLNGAIMYVKCPRHPVMSKLLDHTTEKLRQTQGRLGWAQLGPSVVGRVLQNEEDCTKLPKECFYFYSFVDWKKIFGDNLIDDRMYALHYWGKKAWKFVRRTVTPDYIEASNSLYARAVRKVLGSGGFK